MGGCQAELADDDLVALVIVVIQADVAEDVRFDLVFVRYDLFVFVFISGGDHLRGSCVDLLCLSDGYIV